MMRSVDVDLNNFTTNKNKGCVTLLLVTNIKWYVRSVARVRVLPQHDYPLSGKDLYLIEYPGTE